MIDAPLLSHPTGFKKRVLVMTVKDGEKVIATVKLDEDKDVTISTDKNKEATVKIHDESLDGLSLKVIFKFGSFFLTGDTHNFVDAYDSPSAFYRLYRDESYHLQPGDIMKTGLLTFAAERFNTGIVADVGVRKDMEDTYVIVHDLGLEEVVKISLFSVIDGHGGDWCAHYIRKRLEAEIRV